MFFSFWHLVMIVYFDVWILNLGRFDFKTLQIRPQPAGDMNKTVTFLQKIFSSFACTRFS